MDKITHEQKLPAILIAVAVLNILFGIFLTIPDRASFEGGVLRWGVIIEDLLYGAIWIAIGTGLLCGKYAAWVVCVAMDWILGFAVSLFMLMKQDNPLGS